MGKAQSKRSVDITTETKKGAEDEITEKMGKIEDFDKKEAANGDATMPEKSDEEKKDVEEVENDKDMTTEKDVDVQASGDSAEPQNTETSKEDGGSVTAEEEISPLADESIKKSKKEKVKKKWSFRSISFGKKDKQKPAKSEEVAEDGSAAVTGADANEKTNQESEDTQKDKSANEKEEQQTAETHENGNATPQELNGEQNGEKPSDDKSIDITANTTNNTTTTETSEPVQNETAAVSSELSEKTENTAVINETKTSENAATVDDASKNGNGVNAASDQEPQKPDDTSASVAEASSEKTSLLASAATNESAATTNGELVDQIHQNGDHGESDQAVIDKSKAQIEVNSNTDKNVSAATLDSLSSTSINPSNVQTHVQDLNKASSQVSAELVQINNGEDEGDNNDNDNGFGDKPVVIENSAGTETELNTQTVVVVDRSVDSEIVSTVEVAENVAQVTEDFDALPSKTIEISLPEKLSIIDSPPPPLPISPPPSQVSVFAFTNNDATIQNNNFEPALDNLIEQEKTDDIKPLPEIDNSQEIGSSIPPAATAVSETYGGEKTSSAELQEQLDEVVLDIKCQETKVEEEEEEANLCKKISTEELMTSCVTSEEPQIDEEEDASVAFAATVIHEITETAAEIVNQHLKCVKEQFTPDAQLSSSQNHAQKLSQDELKQNVVNDNVIENKTQDDQDQGLMLLCEKELPLATEQINSKTIECSLDLTESNLMHQNEGEIEMNSLNKSNSLDEIHLDPTKEFATAKDIKDNVTVAEITQDLSVTCE